MLREDPNKRVSAEMCLRHKWFKNHFNVSKVTREVSIAIPQPKLRLEEVPLKINQPKRKPSQKLQPGLKDLAIKDGKAKGSN